MSNQELFSQEGAGIVPARMVAFGEYVEDDTASTMKSRDHKDATDLVASFDEVARPLTARHDSSPCADRGMDVIAVNSNEKFCIPIHDQATRHAGKNGDQNAGKGNGLGIGNENDPAPTLTKGDKHAVAFSCKDHGADAGEISPTLRSMGHDGSHANGGGQVAVAFPINTQLGLRGAETSNSTREGVGFGQDGDPAFTLQRAHSHGVATTTAVRRLTPTECERLQGFPDGHTLIPWRGKPADQCPDGPRYKALGNSMAVPVMAWIGRRIHQISNL